MLLIVALSLSLLATFGFSKPNAQYPWYNPYQRHVHHPNGVVTNVNGWADPRLQHLHFGYGYDYNDHDHDDHDHDDHDDDDHEDERDDCKRDAKRRLRECKTAIMMEMDPNHNPYYQQPQPQDQQNVDEACQMHVRALRLENCEFRYKYEAEKCHSEYYHDVLDHHQDQHDDDDDDHDDDDRAERIHDLLEALHHHLTSNQD